MYMVNLRYQYTITVTISAPINPPWNVKKITFGGSVVWCYVVWCGVVWCGVVWCGVV